MAAQAYKAMNPEPAKKESDIEHCVDKWIERIRKLESHGQEYALAPLYKVIALKKIMIGKAKEYFDIWEADHKEEGGDRGFGKILD